MRAFFLTLLSLHMKQFAQLVRNSVRNGVDLVAETQRFQRLLFWLPSSMVEQLTLNQ